MPRQLQIHPEKCFAGTAGNASTFMRERHAGAVQSDKEHCQMVSASRCELNLSIITNRRSVSLISKPKANLFAMSCLDI